jgi:hypothetical protein
MSISAMKQALEALEEIHRTGDTQAFDLCYAPNVIPALRQAIAEAEKQEPLVWMNKYGHVASFKNDEYTAPLYTAPVHASDISQERVDETAKSEHEFECPRCGHCCKEWVGLTDQEIYDIREDHTYNDEEFEPYPFARAIETRLKEKNTWK